MYIFKPDMVVHAWCILSLKEMKAGGSRDQSHPQVYSSCRLAQAVVKNLFSK